MAETMPRTPTSVTQADIARAIQALQNAGYPNVRVVLREGTVIVEPLPEGGKRLPNPMRIVPL